MTTTTGSASANRKRGFASMDLSRQREVASKGGTAADAQGRAHELTPEEARTAGRKGGAVQEPRICLDGRTRSSVSARRSRGVRHQ
jgi:general stress protein YciG